MNLNSFLLIALCTALLAVLFFITKLRRVRGQLKQSEQAYKRLMTSLSHDVKTPLASLFGYLDAVENGLVAGEEKEAYIHVAVEKACHLKHFVEALFEWVKLVQHFLIPHTLSTRYLRHRRVVVSQQCHRIASFLRLALTKISSTKYMGIKKTLY